ncbi:hypothetical protein Tco_1377859 [Tanacetum coccineum]
MGCYFYILPKNKIVVARYVEFLEKNLISQEASGRTVELEEIQNEDTSPSKNTSKHLVQVESFEPLQEDVALLPALLDPESNKWLDAMNAKMQSIKDNQVWCLVDLPPNAKIVGSASTPEEVKRMQNVPYASAVGSIMYAVRCTRPYVALAKNITSHFQQNSVVDWKNSKQSTTVMSATEAEYIAALEATMEAVWIRNFISGLGIVPIINDPIKMYYDNSISLLIANEHMV